MLTNQFFIILILSITTFLSSCQTGKGKEDSGQNPIDNRLIGKWDVRSKTDSEEIKGVVRETNRDEFQPGEKTYEFTADNKLVITDGFGRDQTIVPVQMLEGKLYLGQFYKGKEPYTLTFTENGLAMVKKEEEQEDGQVIVQLEVVVLERYL